MYKMSFLRHSKTISKLKFKHILNFHRSINAKSLAFKVFGEPINVLEMIERELPDPVDDQVLVEVLLAPINPVDINYIQGRYAKKPKEFPAIAGNEFVAQVVNVGGKVSKIRPGNVVVSRRMGLGGWSTHILLEEHHLYIVPDKVSLVQAATMSINPCTAYRMLVDFTKLGFGDSVIQNGANSAVGQAVHQFCKLWGIISVGLVRDRPDIARLKGYLKRLGATEVFTDKEIKETKVFQECIHKPKLALNCVGGEFAELIAKQLEYKGAMVTYGGMSLKPFRVPAGSLIFRRQEFVGFWLTQWTEIHGKTDAQTEMYSQIFKLMRSEGFLPPPHELIKFEEFKKIPEALTLSNFCNKKFIFDMRTDKNEKH